ncbi:MAG: hypothetical protein JF603_01245 [Acidobacteria bacterium]|nr:hypothetical protein [Acidobacteriota bacterium]
MTTDRSVAAALAIAFDDRAVRRHLALRYPLDLERAKLALDIADRRERRAADAQSVDTSGDGDDDGEDGPEAA